MHIFVVLTSIEKIRLVRLESELNWNAQFRLAPIAMYPISSKQEEPNRKPNTYFYLELIHWLMLYVTFYLKRDILKESDRS